MPVAVLSSARAVASGLSPFAARGLLAGAAAVAMIAGFLSTDSETTARAVALSGDDLTRLLRAMAAIKAVLAVAVIAAVAWRLAAPAAAAWIAAYCAACASMAAGPGLIWGMAHVGSGAALLHGGLLASLLLLWRDPAVSARLAASVAARRARRAS